MWVRAVRLRSGLLAFAVIGVVGPPVAESFHGYADDEM